MFLTQILFCNKITPDQLYDAVKDFDLTLASTTKSERKQAEVHPGGKLVYDGENWRVVEIKDKGAGRWLALNAPFVITDPKSPEDKYPSIEASSKVSVIFPDIDGGKKLNRWLPLVKWLFAIPLLIVGIIYAVIGLVLTFFAWIITSATGNYPESIANYILATIEFWNRLYGYAVILVTDDYPSFTL